MNKTNIDWCDYTWNPVVGCRRGCKFGTNKVSCYASVRHNIRHEAYKKGKMQNHPQYAKPFDVIQYFPERLKSIKKQPGKVFVNSVSDISMWDYDYMEKVLKVCEENPQHIFMFLTKSATVYYTDPLEFPSNCMKGLTLTLDNEYNTELQTDNHVGNSGRLFYSFEPLLGKLEDEDLIAHIQDFSSVERVIVGAMSGSGAVKPKPKWIQSIIDNVPEDKIFWKNNIKKYLGRP